MRQRKPGHVKETGREGVMRACTDLLAVERIRHWRMNAGDRIVVRNGKRYRIKGHEEGTADLLMLVRLALFPWVAIPVWVECKSTDGKQRPAQALFQKEAIENGEYYLLINDARGLQEWVKENVIR